MISDAFVEVECDHPKCTEVERIDLPAGPRNNYLCHDEDIAKELTRLGWRVVDNDRHLCENHADDA